MSLILVVEDERHIARLLEYNLARAGYRVLVAQDGQAALDMVAEANPDAVLLDLNLPVLSGQEVLGRLKADPARAGLVVVVLTAHAFENIPEEVRRSGASACLSKPIAPTTLLAKLEELGVPPRRGEARP